MKPGATQSFKRNLLLILYTEGKKMSDTCRLLPPLAGPEPSYLLTLSKTCSVPSRVWIGLCPGCPVHSSPVAILVIRLVAEVSQPVFKWLWFYLMTPQPRRSNAGDPSDCVWLVKWTLFWGMWTESCCVCRVQCSSTGDSGTHPWGHGGWLYVLRTWPFKADFSIDGTASCFSGDHMNSHFQSHIHGV